MSVRRVGPRIRLFGLGLSMALVTAGFLGLSARASWAVGPSANAPQPPTSTTTATTAPTPSTTVPPTTTTVAPTTTTVPSPPTTSTTTAGAPGTTSAPAAGITAPPSTSVPTTSTTVQQGQPSSTPSSPLAVVASTGDGLLVASRDGTQGPAQAGQDLWPGDQLTTMAPTGAPAAQPATIRWYQGGMTQIYDTEPRIFVQGHKFVPQVQTSVSINADPTPSITVSAGYVRFWFPAGDKQRYSFIAATDEVVATTKGTDFTLGHDQTTGTSTVGVTQDSVEVAPVNPVLRPFQLSSGSQVNVTLNRVGAITALADQSANDPASKSRSTATLALWLVGILLTVAVVAGAVGVWSLWRDRRSSRPTRAPSLARPPLGPADMDLVPTGAAHSTSWVTLPSGEITEPVPLTGQQSRTRGAPLAEWHPTHRVPPEGIGARAIPVADAGDVATLDPNASVRVVEQRGEWANVLSADGWSGWVDAGRLVREPESTDPH